MSGRYQVVELQPDDRGRVFWGVRDTTTDEIVEDEGEPVGFTMRDGAEGWIERQTYLEEAHGVR